jgi:hypothetical protein
MRRPVATTAAPERADLWARALLAGSILFAGVAVVLITLI